MAILSPSILVAEIYMAEIEIFMLRQWSHNYINELSICWHDMWIIIVVLLQIFTLPYSFPVDDVLFIVVIGLLSSYMLHSSWMMTVLWGCCMCWWHILCVPSIKIWKQIMNMQREWTWNAINYPITVANMLKHNIITHEWVAWVYISLIERGKRLNY